MDKHEVILALKGLLSEVVFGNGYLNFGYWPEGSPDQPTFESINEAQERYFEKLLETIPTGVETILDVGSGTGGIAARLSARGFRVDCVSPSFTMNAMARRKLPASATVYDARFEDLDIDAEYDLVLFCESFHYLNTRQALANVRRHASGHVLIFDYFRTRDGDRGDRTSHNQFVSLLTGPFASDFVTVRDEDVTPRVLPTFHVLDALGNTHVKPFLRSFVEQLRRENPFYALLLRWPLARIARKARVQSRRHESFATEREYRLVLLERVRRTDPSPGEKGGPPTLRERTFGTAPPRSTAPSKPSFAEVGRRNTPNLRQGNPGMPSTPPVAPRKPADLPGLHGRRRTDDYAWLKDENWQQVMRDPAVLRADIREYLEAENAYKEAVLEPTEALRAALFEEFRGRIKEDDASVPAKDGAWEYYHRYREGGQHPVVCRRPVCDSGEQILLDGDAEAEGKSYYRIGGRGHAWNHRWFAWTVDENGSEFFTLRVKDLEAGNTLDDTIERCSGGFVWAADHETLFYTVLDDNHRPCKVLRHRIGTNPADDAVVYEESDAGFFLNVALTESRRFVVIDAHDHVTSEVRLVDAARPESAPVLVAARDPMTEYDVSQHGDHLIILTNAGGAEDFRIVETPVASPGREHWADLVPHRPGVLIVGFEVYARWLVRLERENALPRIVVRDLESGGEHAIAFDEEAYSLGLAGGYEYDTDTLRFTYSSMTTPEHVYDYDMRTRERTVRKVQEVPSGHDPEDYVTRRIMAASHDGEMVPVSVLHRRDTIVDGTAPLLLYGYGSYGMSMPASFGTTRLSLVDRGFVYAVAHVRGGTERGYAWYTGGKLAKKTNTFKDFIAAANALADQGFTRRGRIAIHGGSAGGLLVGACTNMAPELFHAVIAEVPFVDVLNTICDDTLPLTPPEWPEWGNPIRNEAAWDCIAAYSPYDNVEARDYPHIIATAGLTDPRVTYWEPAKWVAKLRATKTDDRLLVLHTNMEAGHGGAAGRFDRLKETALVYAFVLHVFGIAAG